MCANKWIYLAGFSYNIQWICFGWLCIIMYIYFNQSHILYQGCLNVGFVGPQAPLKREKGPYVCQSVGHKTSHTSHLFPICLHLVSLNQNDSKWRNPIFENKSQPKIWQNSPNSLFDILIALNYSLVLKVRSILFLSKLQAPKTSIYLPTISLSIYYINPQRVHFQLVFYFFNFYLITPSWLILY